MCADQFDESDPEEAKEKSSFFNFFYWSINMCGGYPRSLPAARTLHDPKAHTAQHPPCALHGALHELICMRMQIGLTYHHCTLRVVHIMPCMQHRWQRMQSEPLCVCVAPGSGAVIASLLVVNVQVDVSWTVGYIVPTAAFGVALALIIAGSALYVYVPPGGSAFKRIGEVPAPLFWGTPRGPCLHAPQRGPLQASRKAHLASRRDRACRCYVWKRNWVSASRSFLSLHAPQEVPLRAPLCRQVLFAAMAKCGVRPPANPAELYEEDGASSIKGSRKLVHSNQYRRAVFCAFLSAMAPSGLCRGLAYPNETIAFANVVVFFLMFPPVCVGVYDSRPPLPSSVGAPATKPSSKPAHCVLTWRHMGAGAWTRRQRGARPRCQASRRSCCTPSPRRAQPPLLAL